jgi:predicted DNA-binding protein
MVRLSRDQVAGETHGLVKGPTKRDERISIRLPGDVHSRLKSIASADGRSVADWSYRAIERELLRAERHLAKKRATRPED